MRFKVIEYSVEVSTSSSISCRLFHVENSFIPRNILNDGSLIKQLLFWRGIVSSEEGIVIVAVTVDVIRIDLIDIDTISVIEIATSS